MDCSGLGGNGRLSYGDRELRLFFWEFWFRKGEEKWNGIFMIERKDKDDYRVENENR